jgi:hypothetical protein
MDERKMGRFRYAGIYETSMAARGEAKKLKKPAGRDWTGSQ